MASPAIPLRTTRLVLAALALGLLTFGGIVVFLRASGMSPKDNGIGGVLAMTLAFMAVANTAIYFVLRKQLLARAQTSKAEALALLSQDLVPPHLNTLTILGAALAEGVGLFGVVTVLLGGPWYALAAPAVAVVLILALFPTRERLEQAVRGV